MVVGGEVVTLKSIEESTGILMPEMPMQVSLLTYSDMMCFWLYVDLMKFIFPWIVWSLFIYVSIFVDEETRFSVLSGEETLS